MFAGGLGLGIGLAFSEACWEGLNLHELGHVTSSDYVVYSTCSETTRGGAVSETSVFYWYPVLLGIAGAIGAWYTTALITRRVSLWTATGGVTVALVVFLIG